MADRVLSVGCYTERWKKMYVFYHELLDIMSRNYATNSFD